MPWATREKHRAYQRKYNKKPEVAKRLADRKTARNRMIKAGKVKKGDGKDVGHKKPLKNGGTNAKSNLTVQSRAKNRGYKRGRPGHIKKS